MTRHRSVVLVSFVVVFALALPARAVIFEVDRLDDPFPAQVCDSGVAGDCSLREAVINANATAGPDLIILPAGTYSLTRPGSGEDVAVTGDLDITEAVRIEGAGEVLTIIDGGGPGGLGDRIIDIHGADVEIDNLTIRGGSGVLGAGGLYNRSGTNTQITNTTITSNTADIVDGFGGGMQNAGTCTLINSTVHDNEASRAGGIDAAGVTTFQDSRITNNRALATRDWGGGGILSFQPGTTTTLIRTVVSGNTSAKFGGGLHAHGPTVIEDSIFELNHATETGGGISVGPSRTVTIERSSLIGNTSGSIGGAICVEDTGTLDLTNSTISGNQATVVGGGLMVYGVATLVNSTISRNTAQLGTAMMSSPISTVIYGNTIFDGNCAASGDTVTLGGNIESPGNFCGLSPTLDQFNVAPLALRLGPLGYYGGSTPTHLPVPGSVAIDTGIGCPPPQEDQRGLTRPIDGDGDSSALCDVGSVEALLIEYPWLFLDGFETGDTQAWQ